MNTLPSITCPKCGKTSTHPKDIAYGYCGFCHDWTGDKSPSDKAARVLLQMCPECYAGKHGNCDTTTWDFVADEPGVCPCFTEGHQP